MSTAHHTAASHKVHEWRYSCLVAAHAVGRLTEYALSWGATAAETERAQPCDKYIAEPDHTYWRGVSVRAPVPCVYRWLCQLRAAPYSYDWIDNLWRTSPRELVPGLEQLAAGQRAMTIFRIVETVYDGHITLVLASPRARKIFGDIAITYSAAPDGPGTTRLLVKMVVRYPRTGAWRCMRLLLPWGDLIMMRKQLLTLKALAERSASLASEKRIYS